MQGSDCAGVLVLAPARQGIPCWTYVEELPSALQCSRVQCWTYVEEKERRNPPVQQGPVQNFLCAVSSANSLNCQNCTQ